MIRVIVILFTVCCSCSAFDGDVVSRIFFRNPKKSTHQYNISNRVSSKKFIHTRLKNVPNTQLNLQRNIRLILFLVALVHFSSHLGSKQRVFHALIPKHDCYIASLRLLHSLTSGVTDRPVHQRLVTSEIHNTSRGSN